MEPNRRRLGRPAIAALFLVLVFAAAGSLVYVKTRGPAPILLTGIVTTDDVRVGAMTQGRLVELRVGPGDAVAKGDLLARIEPQESLADVAFYQNNEKASAATVAEAAAQLELLEMQTREQIRQAEANLAASRARAAEADANLESARLELERQESLRERQLNSQQELDRARTGHEGAAAAADSAHKQVQASEAALSLARANAEQVAARRATLEATRQQLAAAGAQTEKAKVRLAYTKIRAPIAGIVDVRAALEGEIVNPGETILTLIDPDDLWVRADVEESYIERIHLGDEMQVRLPSGQTRECGVFYRAVDADYATQRDVSRTKRDIKTFEIRLRCDNSSRSLAVGMTAYVLLPLA